MTSTCIVVRALHMPANNQFHEYEISTKPERLDIAVIHAFLTQSYWSLGIPRAVVERAINNSLCFGLYRGAEQVGFARVVTDKATFAFLADVFILEAHRGKGLSNGSCKSSKGTKICKA